LKERIEKLRERFYLIVSLELGIEDVIIKTKENGCSQKPE
jgi:hypothetical protein